MRNARICRVLSVQGVDVVCATISLLHDVHRWNRVNIPSYHEIYLRVPLEELTRRDPKGLYASARRGELKNVVGLDIPVEEPTIPDLIIDNYGRLDAAAAADLILERFCNGSVPEGAAPLADTVILGTKAETLDRLRPVLRSARVLPQVRFTVAEWQRAPEVVRARIAAEPWSQQPLIVRSSAQNEDGGSASHAGKYHDRSGMCAVQRNLTRQLAE